MELRKSSKKKKIFISLAILLGVGGASYGGYTIYQKKAVQVTADEIMPMQVKDFMAEGSGSVGMFSGVVEPQKIEKISFDSQRGQLSKVLVNEGDTVKVGTPLFTYDNPDAEVELKQKNLDLELANVQINEAYVAVNEAKKSLNNAKEEEEKVPLRKEVAQAESALKSALISKDKLVLEIEESKKKVAKNTVASTIDGIIQKINREATSGENQATSTFMSIVSTGNYFVKGMINELVMDQVKVNQKVTIRSRINPEQTWTGKVTEIGKLPTDGNNQGGSPEMDMGGEPMNPNSSTYPFKVLLDKHDGLQIGYHVFIEPTVENKDTKMIKIIQDFIVREEKKAYVWLVDKEQKLKKHEITIGKEFPEELMVEVVKGLKQEDYIVAPGPNVKEGKKVTIHAPAE